MLEIVTSMKVNSTIDFKQIFSFAKITLWNIKAIICSQYVKEF